MKDYKEIDKLVFEFGEHTNRFAEQYSAKQSPVIRTELQELMYKGFLKEIEAITECEKVDIKYKKKFYNKLLRAKSKLITLDRADAWFDKVFQKYFNRGVLEHLIVYAILFLHKKDLFVAKRLFKQINNDKLLAEFTSIACNYLGWTSQNEPTEQLTADETETTEEQQEIEKNQTESKETAQGEEQCTDVTIYEPQEVQPIEQPSQPVVKVERTVTHEVMTTTPGATMAVTQTNEEVVTNDVEGQTVPPKSVKKDVPSFFQPGGKSTKK